MFASQCRRDARWSVPRDGASKLSGQAAGVASAVLVTIGDLVFDANAFTAANDEDVVNVPNVAGDVNCYECFQLLLLPPLISQLKCLKKLLVIGNQLKAVFLFYLLMRKSRCREKITTVGKNGQLITDSAILCTCYRVNSAELQYLET